MLFVLFSLYLAGISHICKIFYVRQLTQELQTRCFLSLRELKPCIKKQDIKLINQLCHDIGKSALMRITVIAFSGDVLGDSEQNYMQMKNHSDRPEFIQAIKGTSSSSIRFSPDLQKKMIYVAIPIDDQGHILGVLRASVPYVWIELMLKPLYVQITMLSIVLFCLIYSMGFYFYTRFMNTAEKLKKGAQEFALGNFQERLELPRSNELLGVAIALNDMAEQLDDRLQAIIKQKNELDAVFASMMEGVVAIDQHEKILHINQQACDWLDLQPDHMTNANIYEHVRNIELQTFIRKVLDEQQFLERNFVIVNESERIFQVRGNVLKDDQSKTIGALFVFNNITSLKKLEQAQKDFVANVSHELKTPITSIQGFVETLLDGKVEDTTAVKRFLEIVQKQVQRLNYIVEDLLELSRIEKDEENGKIELSLHDLKSVIEVVIEACKLKANSKKIIIKVNDFGEIQLSINARLLEQAIINLLDNAIKYSNENGVVEVLVEQEKNSVMISICDYGCGIEKEHLSRIFERFYRVDKARSRNLGGTGLGLAITHHIIKAHRGSISVESVPFKGSTFKISVPY